MMSVEIREAIRRAYYVEKKSIRQIARDLHVSRKTVDKALLSAVPQPYTLTTPRTAPILGPFRERIAQLLAENAHLPRKQQYTSPVIFRILQAEGYQGSESGIRTYIASLRRSQHRSDLFLPLDFDPGADAQVDWGEAVATIAGHTQPIQLFVMRLCYSRRLFVMAFPSQKQECFFAGHIHAFQHFAGVPHRVTYDNVTTAVRRVLAGRNRQEQAAFIVFRSHYLFASHFCTPGQGHEKGSVEHGVGYARRQFLVPIPEVDSFAALNDHLLAACLRDDQRRVHGHTPTIAEAWSVERSSFLPLPTHAFPCYRPTAASVNPYSQIVFETNRYSVPVEQAVKHLTVHAYPFHLDLLHQNQVIATHPRCYGRHQDIFDPLHYLSLLEQRPGAFDHAKPIRQWRMSWPVAYTRLLYRLREAYPDGTGIREFLRVLRLLTIYPAAVVEAAITQALTYGCIQFDGVRLCVHQLLHPDQIPPPVDLSDHPQLATIGTQPLNLHLYDQLLTGDVDGPHA